MTDNRQIPVVILCGGQGTRIREASESLPKPMVDIGGKPILWHIMKIYSHHGYRRFILCLGYKGWEIKRYFMEYRENLSNFTVHLKDEHGRVFHDDRGDEDWEITFAETGLNAGTGTRLRRIREFVDTQRFLMTYGDGIAAIDLAALAAHHDASGLIGTVTGVHPTSRYGEMHVDGDRVVQFNEKPTHVSGFVSGGFFAFERSFLDDYLDDTEDLFLELGPLQRLARDGGLGVYQHEGFWAAMDTYREYLALNEAWSHGDAPWKVWEH